MNFLKTFLASILGTIIGLSLLFLIFFAILISTSTEPEPYVRDNTVLKIDLSGTIVTRTVDDPLMELFDMDRSTQVSLERLKNNLEKAAADDRIKGVWLNVDRLAGNRANLESAYEHLRNFKDESGKFVYASTNDLGMNENAWYLASAADSIFAPPATYLEFNGFAVQASYFKNLLEKIGIEPEIMRVGTYKSAVEPFLREDSSPEHREQTMAILDSAMETFLDAAQRKTGMDRSQIDQLMNEIPENSVEWAYENNLIDVIAHKNEVDKAIANRIGLEEDESPRTISLNRYNRVSASSAGLEEPATRDRIAVIYASGAIMPDIPVSPFSSGNIITARSVERNFDRALENDDVKAIVFHVNSGGGAMSTSELIWNTIQEARKEKPVIAYMGNVAASGGYYISMAADTIVASPNTITGSIGIFNQLFNMQELYNEKLGITFDTFKTHDHADLGMMTRPLTTTEREALQRSIESGYEFFIGRVGESRGMTRDEVDTVAQGRVWTGLDAKDRNLVDMVGTLDRAVAIAAEKAEIEEYGIITLPERKDLFERLFGSANAQMRTWVGSMLPYSTETLDEIHSLQELMRHPAAKNWAILPYRYTIE